MVGPGGVGKTRVALEVAARSEAVTVLLLASVADPTAVPHALAAALDLKVVQGDVLAASAAILGDRSGLLLVAVFLDRAARVRPGPAPTPAELRLVADIVRRLDGMPLAIELAAGRLSSFSLADLHHRLDRSLDLLGGGRPGTDARHRTLRATVEWSYDLLSSDERRLFRHLSVFVDGSNAAVAHADTTWWSGWPVMPSGPKVSTVSGRTRSITSQSCATASDARAAVHSPSR